MSARLMACSSPFEPFASLCTTAYVWKRTSVLTRYRLVNAPSSSSPKDRPHTAAVNTEAYSSLLSRPGCSERAHSIAAANAKTRVFASDASTSSPSSFASFPSAVVSPATTAQSLLVKIL